MEAKTILTVNKVTEQQGAWGMVEAIDESEYGEMKDIYPCDGEMSLQTKTEGALKPGDKIEVTLRKL